jgi:Tfp pilus assembly protein PilX
MTTRRSQHLPSDTRGAALLAALCFSLVLAIVLSSYITMCYRSLQMSARNASSGHSVELAETGMEEALWALHNNDWTGWSISSHTATKTLAGFTFDSNATGSASLSIANYDGTTGTRTITATGTLTLSDLHRLAGTALRQRHRRHHQHSSLHQWWHGR